jgi:hypothetical protein
LGSFAFRYEPSYTFERSECADGRVTILVGRAPSPARKTPPSRHSAARPGLSVLRTETTRSSGLSGVRQRRFPSGVRSPLAMCADG